MIRLHINHLSHDPPVRPEVFCPSIHFEHGRPVANQPQVQVSLHMKRVKNTWPSTGSTGEKNDTQK